MCCREKLGGPRARAFSFVVSYVLSPGVSKTGKRSVHWANIGPYPTVSIAQSERSKELELLRIFWTRWRRDFCGEEWLSIRDDLMLCGVAWPLRRWRRNRESCSYEYLWWSSSILAVARQKWRRRRKQHAHDELMIFLLNIITEPRAAVAMHVLNNRYSLRRRQWLGTVLNKRDSL
jgi:hypothetical protein